MQPSTDLFQDPLCTHNISRTVQSLPSGGTADLGWILMAEEFHFAKYSEKCNSLLRLHNLDVDIRVYIQIMKPLLFCN